MNGRIRAGLLGVAVVCAMAAPIAATAHPAGATTRGGGGGVLAFAENYAATAPQAIVYRGNIPATSDDRLGYALLGDNNHTFQDPTWSPDGSRIAYASSADGNLEIWTATSSGDSPVKLTATTGVSNTQPAWSPDGTRIAFVSDRDGNNEIYSMSATDGSALVRLTNNASNDNGPAYAPNGQRIAFSSNRNDTQGSHLWTMNVDGTNQKVLNKWQYQPEYDTAPDWSPDGSLIVFEMSGNIVFVTADGSRRLAFTNNPSAGDGKKHNPVFSPDGSRIAFSQEVCSGNSCTAFQRIKTAEITRDPTVTDFVWGGDPTLVAYSNNINMTHPTWRPGNTTPPAPENLALPTIKGSTVEGRTLTRGVGAWATADAPTFTYQWYRCNTSGESCTAITGATGPSRVLGAADVGHKLKVQETATNDDGSSSATSISTWTAVSKGAPLNIARPAITGTMHVGSKVHVSNGSWRGTASLKVVKVMWRRCDVNGNNCAGLATATKNDYVLTKADKGHKMRATVWVSNSLGSVSALSAPSAKVS